MALVTGYVSGVFARPAGFEAPNGEARVEGEPGLHRSARLGDLPGAPSIRLEKMRQRIIGIDPIDRRYQATASSSAPR